jgi:hypothetical protein
VNILKADPATQGNNSTDQTGCPAKQPILLPPNFTDFTGLLLAVPLGERTLREEIKKGHIPAIRMPGGRRLLFHMPSVERALLRFQRGGIE